MKAIMKKVMQLTGVTLDIKDIQNYLEDVEIYLDAQVVVLHPDQKVTVKVKGKIVETSDVQISFETLSTL